MPNELVPYQGRDDIAYLNRELASQVDQVKSEVIRATSVFRVSDTYVGRYGVLGFVEMSLVAGPEYPMLAGIIEVPGRLPEAMRNVSGMTGYISEVVFKNTNFFGEANKEVLSHPSLKEIVLLDGEYYWYPHIEHAQVEHPKINQRIKELEDRVIEFITEFDKILDRFVPENKRPTYSSLLMLGPGQVEQ